MRLINSFNPSIIRRYGAILVAAFLLLSACAPATKPQSAPATNSENKTAPVATALPTSADNITAPAAAVNDGWLTLASFSGDASDNSSVFFSGSSHWRASWSYITAMPQFASFNLFIYNASTGELAGSQLCSSCPQRSGQLVIRDYPGSYYLKIICANLSGWKVDIEQEPSSISSSPVQITLIHHLGTPTPLACCNDVMTEKDEFVVIYNFGDNPQNLHGWKLKSLNKDYISFTFPEYFPCIPYSGDRYTEIPPTSVESRMMTLEQTVDARELKASQIERKIDWSKCIPANPLDQSPMQPVNSESGLPLPCIIYPNHSLLVFTDEIHCRYGGLNFNYGQGDIWDNFKADSAVLINAQGEEVSRRSYTTSRQP